MTSSLERAKVLVRAYLEPRLTRADLKEASRRIALLAQAAVLEDRTRRAAGTVTPPPPAKSSIGQLFDDLFRDIGL